MGTGETARIGWVDYGKGFCIVFVVMMHATLGVEMAMGREGWLHAVVAFAKPFRMPDFFLISGLFLARVIDRDWRTYLDRKVVHFAYFYVLWLTVQFAFKAPGIMAEHGWAETASLYLLSYVEPFGTLWFIYLLPVFFVVTKLLRGVPPLAVWLIAAALEIAPVETHSLVIDEFAARFVYFYTGYVLAGPIFTLAAQAQAHQKKTAAALAVWIVLNGALVFSGFADRPFISLALGFLGVMAVVTFCALLAQGDRAPWLRYCGEHSIVIYLAFFLPMVASRVVLLRGAWITDPGWISVLVTATGVAGALAIYWLVRRTRLRILFERPQRFRIDEKPRAATLQPAE